VIAGQGARRLVMIAALAATLGAVYWASGLQEGSGEADVVAPVAPERAAPPTRARSDPAPVPAAPGPLDLARLQRQPSAEPAGELFGQPPAALAPVPRTRGTQAPAVEEAPPPPPPEPPPLPFKYLGQLAEADRKMVFLTAGDRNLVVGAGDVIDNVYRVDEIGPESLLLTYLPMNVQQTLSTGAAQ